MENIHIIKNSKRKNYVLYFNMDTEIIEKSLLDQTVILVKEIDPSV